MDEFKRKLEETLNRLYKENKLSIDAYSELMEFADPNQNLQLQQTGVIRSCYHNCTTNYCNSDGSYSHKMCDDCGDVIWD